MKIRAGQSDARIIVFGLMFDLPFAGIIAQFLNYLVGLRDLGYDVWYIEDSLSWPYDPRQRTMSSDPASSIRSVAAMLERHGFGNRWIYRCAVPEVTCFGSSAETLAELYRTADIALNVTGAQNLRDEHEELRYVAYVQSDPFGLQADVENGDVRLRNQLARHHAFFTFGELVGTTASTCPTAGIQWQPTRQPVALALWPFDPSPGTRFTTVTSWRNDAKHRVWQGQKYYWTKDREFLAISDLPRRTSAKLELAIDGVPPEADELIEHGWRLPDRHELTSDVDAYQSYIVASRGEFTVARDQVVRPRTGWFSDRSACYLASGRAVVTQDTGFGDILPTGDGLFAFAGTDQAVAALDEIERNPVRHGAAARAIAEEYFAAQHVLSDLLHNLT